MWKTVGKVSTNFKVDGRKIEAVAKLMIRDVRAGDIEKFPACWGIGDVSKIGQSPKMGNGLMTPQSGKGISAGTAHF